MREVESELRELRELKSQLEEKLVLSDEKCEDLEDQIEAVKLEHEDLEKVGRVLISEGRPPPSSEKMGSAPPTAPPSKMPKKGKFCKNHAFLGNFAHFGQKCPPSSSKIP